LPILYYNNQEYLPKMNASSPAFAQSQDGSKDTGVERAAEKFAPSRIDLGLASHRSGPAIADDEMLSRRLSASHPAQVVFADEEALKSADKAPGALRPNSASFLRPNTASFFSGGLPESSPIVQPTNALFDGRLANIEDFIQALVAKVETLEDKVVSQNEEISLLKRELRTVQDVSMTRVKLEAMKMVTIPPLRSFEHQLKWKREVLGMARTGGVEWALEDGGGDDHCPMARVLYHAMRSSIGLEYPMAMKCNTAAEIWKYFQQKEDLEDRVLAMAYEDQWTHLSLNGRDVETFMGEVSQLRDRLEQAGCTKTDDDVRGLLMRACRDVDKYQGICIAMECARVDRSLEATFRMLRKVDIQEQAQRMAEAARAGRTHEAGAAGYGEGKGGPQRAAARVSVTSSSAGGGQSAQRSQMWTAAGDGDGTAEAAAFYSTDSGTDEDDDSEDSVLGCRHFSA